MSAPAKDEAELLEQVVLATCECHPGECYVKMGQMLCCAEDDKVEAVFAAIRAAGWAVVPQEPTEEIQDAIINAAFNIEHIADDEAVKIYQAAIKAAAPRSEAMSEEQLALAATPGPLKHYGANGWTYVASVITPAEEDALAAIRAAGWAVVPVAVMDEVSTLIASTYSHVDGRDLLGDLHPRYTLDIKRRVDGVETWHQGDWLSEVMHCRNRLINLLAAAPGVKP